MANSNLALLDRAVQATIAHELGDGDHDTQVLAELGVVPQRTRKVAGLTVVRNAARDADVDQTAATMFDKLLRYRADRALVIEKLRRVDVEPIAVLPLKAWDSICTSSKLFRFVPRGDVVRIDGSAFVTKAKAATQAKVEKNSTRNAFIAFCIWLAFMALFGLASYFLSGWFVIGDLVTFVIGIVFGTSDSSVNRAQLECDFVAQFVKEEEIDGTLFSKLWPDFREPAKGIDIRIDLPAPPPEVQARLIAAERTRLPLHLAVVAEAIAFKDQVDDILSGAHKEHVESLPPPKSWLDLFLDPIAYVIEGSAVAIVDQYGDFPIETRAINEVINSEHLV